MNNLTDLQQLNISCFHYLLGMLTVSEETKLKERLKADKALRLWFDWLLLKWLKMTWMRKRLAGRQ